MNMDYLRIVQAADARASQMLACQVMDETRPDYGGYFADEYGFASPSHIGNALFIQRLGCCYFCKHSVHYANPEILQRLLAAVAFQKRCQRPSGLIDIPFTNFDSPSDTGFAVSAIAMPAYMAKQADFDGGQRFWEAVKPYLLSSAKAIAAGGFHTPNHRWVVSSAMAQVMELIPELDLTDAINAYLKEGIDINPDGFYSERSTGGYNAVVNRQLIYLAEIMRRDDLLAHVSSNLHCMMRLFHHDWSVVTSVSLRQDKGKKTVPINAADGFYYTAMQQRDGVLAQAASALLERGGYGNDFLLYLFARHPEWLEQSLPEGAPLASFSTWMKDSGIYRIRRGKLSVTVVNGLSGVLSLRYGAVELAEMRLFSPYFAGAKFTGRKMEPIEGGIRVTMQSDFLLPQLPGYWMPLGRPVAFASLPYHSLEERKLNKRPEFTFYLDITEQENALSLHVETAGGMAGVPFLAEFLFTPEGHVETSQISVPAAAGQTMLLKEGALTFVNGCDGVTLSPGCHAHRSNINGSEGAQGVFRVVLSDFTPVDRTWTLAFHHWTEGTGPYYAAKGPAHLGTNA